MDYYNKHYIRLHTNDCIVKGFSDAFEEPEEGDICINQKGGRHFELFGQINPALCNMQGQPIYLYENEVIRELTAEEQSSLFQIPVPEPTETEILRAENEKLKSQIEAINIALAEIVGV